MRVSTSEQHAQLVRDLQEVRQRQVDGWDKVAKGVRINQPADYPGDAIQLLGVKQEIDQVNHYLNSIATLSAQLSMDDSLLQSYNGNLQAIRELILKANNPALGQEGINALAQELEQWKKGVVDLMNTQDAEGYYVFAGFQTATPPVTTNNDGYLFNNDPHQRQVYIARNTQIAANNTAHELCFAIRNNDGGTFNLINSLDTLHQTLLHPPEDFSDQLAAHLIKIDQATAQAGGVQTDLGARLKTLENFQDSFQQSRMYYQQQAGRLGDLDYAEALTRLNQDKVTIEAASKGLSEVSQLALFNYL